MKNAPFSFGTEILFLMADVLFCSTERIVVADHMIISTYNKAFSKRLQC